MTLPPNLLTLITSSSLTLRLRMTSITSTPTSEDIRLDVKHVVTINRINVNVVSEDSNLNLAIVPPINNY